MLDVFLVVMFGSWGSTSLIPVTDSFESALVSHSQVQQHSRIHGRGVPHSLGRQRLHHRIGYVLSGGKRSVGVVAGLGTGRCGVGKGRRLSVLVWQLPHTAPGASGSAAGYLVGGTRVSTVSCCQGKLWSVYQ